jgi:preprotein translocase subunit SecD
VLNDDPALSGADIYGPRQSFQEEVSDVPDITFGFSSHGGEVFEHLTREIARRGQNAQLPGVSEAEAEQHFVIVLDGQVITAPAIDYTQYPEGIDARNGSEITGGFTVASARALADELRFGALPVKLELVSVARVSSYA